MIKKYYLKIEIRYTAYTPDEDEETGYKEEYYTKVMHSDLFDNEKECINYGNNIIEANKWAEQYPGYIGSRLDKRFGKPLIAPSLKNGAKIYISVETQIVCNQDEINAELQKFNIPLIKNKIG